MRTPFALAASATAMLLAGCSDPARGSGTDDLDQTDIEGLVDVRTDLDPDQPDDASNIDADIGSGSDADQPGPDPAGPCDDDADCPTGTCVELAPGLGGFCALPCLADEDCGIDEACLLVTNSGGDATRVCIPVDFCADLDRDGFGAGPGCLGVDCDDATAAANVGANEVCDGIDNDCDGGVDNAPVDVGQNCGTGFAGACADGRVECTAGAPSCVALRSPADEVCDGLDNDCDGEIDNGPVDAAVWFVDADGDRFGSPDNSTLGCEAPPGHVDAGGDCDDTNVAINPTVPEVCDGVDNDCDGTADEPDAGDVATWYADLDGDGFGDPSAAIEACEAPPGHADNPLDCDDLRAATNPGALETCNERDDDCDTFIDNDPIDQGTWYADGDGDGFGDPAAPIEQCGVPGGYVDNPLDCDDGAGLINPAAAELCNGRDDDCDDAIDDDATDPTTFFADADGDGFGDHATSIARCSLPSGYVDNSLDCDDAARAVNPGALETCNGRDDDCDTAVDDDPTDPTTFYADADGDTWGRLDQPVGACTQPPATALRPGDCDDASAAVRPDATELCDGLDGNCNGLLDEPYTPFYRDLDGDGYGTTADVVLACANPGGRVTTGNDCDDGNPRRSPGLAERCDGIDNNCDGGFTSIDRRGRTVEYDAACQNYGGGNSNDLCFGEAWEGQGYMHCHYHLSWDSARAVCQARGMDLTDLGSDAEATAVLTAFNGQDGESWDDLWIGGRENGAARSFSWVRTGFEFWRNGSVGAYSRWRSGEPSNDSGGGTDDCVSPRQSDFGWNDRSCGGTIEFICEW